ncbi:hypothetical protein CRG98_002663 [Punica granatum]|uniref:Uncharacterized protein n=1 Tax=Punica granatum TaxID=22663 RepID=A0A2I0L8I3_PUNGR|nr:hypothetical protein CRG98_002663 [Punica granatum]
MLIETPVDWIFLRTAAEFWDPRHAVFNFQGTELAPTIEDYTTLIQKPTPTTQGIFVPNPFAGPPRSGNKLQMTFRSSTGFLEGRFSGHECLPASLRGTPTENRDRSDPRAPQDIQGILRKSWSQVPRPSRANGLRSGTTSQRSFTGQKGHRNECRDAQTAIGDRGTLNSAPNVQTGQNRLSRRQVARAFVHTTHGDIRLIQILVIQAFQIYKLIGHRRSDTSSIKSPTNPVSHRAVAGASVPTRFPEIAATALLSGRSTRSSKPSLATLKEELAVTFLARGPRGPLVLPRRRTSRPVMSGASRDTFPSLALNEPMLHYKFH